MSGKRVAHAHVCVFSRDRTGGAHLDEQWCQSFAAELLVHTQEVDLRHALSVAPYTHACRHSCTAKLELLHACQQVGMANVSALKQAQST